MHNIASHQGNASLNLRDHQTSTWKARIKRLMIVSIGGTAGTLGVEDGATLLKTVWQLLVK